MCPPSARAAIAALILLLLAGAPCRAQIVSGQSGATVSGSRSSAPWGTVYVPDQLPTIQAAIDAVPDGVTVVVRPGVYLENIDFQGKAIEVRSEAGPHLTTIDGGGQDSVVTFASAETASSVLAGFRITGGDHPSKAGGIHCSGASPTIQGNIVIGNRGAGGIWALSCCPLIEGNVITSNHAVANGGALLSVNSAYPRLRNDLIAYNTATWAAGGLLVSGASRASVSNCTIYGNASGNGGGVYCGNSTVVLSDCILWDNTATGLGPEMYADNGGTLDIRYSDLRGGQASVWLDGTSTLLWGAGMMDAHPQFAAGPGGAFYLSQVAAGQALDSPCVDAGDPGSAMIEGTTRTDLVQDAGILDLGYHFE